MIINIEDIPKFSDFIINNIKRNDYRYKYLINALDAIFTHKANVSVRSFINVEDESWLIFIELEVQIFIYGFNYSDLQISHFVKTINLKEYNSYEIMGTRELVYKILAQSQIHDYRLIKDRCFYQLTEYQFTPEEANINLATQNDLNELIVMFQNYYIEEYNGERNKSVDVLIPIVTNLIYNKSLYVIKDDSIITVFCSIIDPDIGIIYTREDYRGQGIGRRLLEYCSSLLFNKNQVVYIMTDMHNQASNIICKKIGYDLIYEHTNLKI